MRELRSLTPGMVPTSEAQVKLLKCIIAIAGVLVGISQVVAEEDPASDIRALKARLKMLEQRVDNQRRQDRREAKVAAALPSKASVAHPGRTITSS